MDYINKKILNYRVTRIIGEGGMATVYEAVHTTFDDRKVAIKILNPILTANKNIRQRFVNEAKIMASLSHPNIVNVLDFEEQEQTLAIVMELMAGKDLTTYIHQKGALEAELTKKIMSQVLDAFTFAHNKDVVHRDIKPSNIFILNDGTPKILDFGIAKLLSGIGEFTTTGVQMGTLTYMSPEQVKDSKHIDARTDIYSLGVTLFYMLSGKKAYDTTSMSDYDVRKAIVEMPFPKLEFNTQFQPIIDKATAKLPQDRFQSCQEFKNAILNPASIQKDGRVETDDKTLIDQTFQPQQVLETSLNEDDKTIVESDPETQLWLSLKDNTDKQLFANYLQIYPSGKYAAEAKKQIGQIITVPKNHKTDSFKTPIIIAAVAAIAIILFFILKPSENREWQNAQNTNTIEAYEQFLADYPDGAFVAQATENIDWLTAQETHTIDGYHNYMQQYGDNASYLEMASRQIANLQFEAASPTYTLSQMRKFMAADSLQLLTDDYQSKATDLLAQLVKDSTEYASNEALRKADTDAYNQAKKKATKEAYEAYIKENPNGQYIADAKKAIENIGKFNYETVYVSGGTFQMGSNDGFSNEKPVHSVTVSSFNIGKYEVTQAQWKAIMGSNPSYFKGDNLPVEQVSWTDIQTFLQKLKQQTGKTYRLPTEAEWEYAAGGGSSNRTNYAGTGSESNLGSYAWYTSGSKTHNVGSKSPNRLGIYDMSGNVWEWCSDCYGNYSSGSQTNPRGASGGSSRVDRGGGWSYDAGCCRVAIRYSAGPGSRSNRLGFRLVFVP